jgi:hypothetical protein
MMSEVMHCGNEFQMKRSMWLTGGLIHHMEKETSHGKENMQVEFRYSSIVARLMSESEFNAIPPLSMASLYMHERNSWLGLFLTAQPIFLLYANAGK